MSSLELTLLYLCAAVVSVVGCRLMHLPAMLGYLFAGVVIGPNALALAKDSVAVEHLAEFGVVFLMFVIGLEFNLPKLMRMRKLVFGLGLGQVVLTLIGALLLNIAIGLAIRQFGQSWQVSWQTALALGSAMAMSSTAIVVKLMSDRIEMESPHGQRVMGVLLFQDLAVVPLLVLIPALADMADNNLWRVLGIALLKASVLVGLLLWGGQRVMRKWLNLVARRKSDELFMLNLLFMTLGLAWLTELAGLSLAMGAFLAGMLIAETDFKHQVEADIRPFHDVLLGLFFITIGMKLDWEVIHDSWGWVLLLSVVPVLLKAGLVFGLARLQGAAAGVSLRTAIYLAQAGEFGFVLLSLSAQNALIPAEWMSPILASMVLSMIATPFLVMNADRIVNRLISNDWLMQSLALTGMAQRTLKTENHVIVCGYGRCGHSLVDLFKSEGIAYVALDSDPDKVQAGRSAGNLVEFGDATRLASLMSAGLVRASAVVVTYPDTPSALKVLAWATEHAPQVPVIVRTHDDHDLERLRAAGAAEVVPEVLEGSLMLASQTLAHIGIPLKRVIRLVQGQRMTRYAMMRDAVPPADDAPAP
ncbi:cation:proton antiporter [Limnohabitans sp. B9-3]|uniref:cation:proton antiporter n=1 Tax=Limnohabitans sp. B9-3 TaxID=1100707 RepID=UPI000C1E8AFE|nr:cation:proton antiporter [Limnohabitans sp. B9-3]PIT78754.1 potassium transporter [Limnohabitans sp. B9-3]